MELDVPALAEANEEEVETGMSCFFFLRFLLLLPLPCVVVEDILARNEDKGRANTA